jgi:hypothetical protein
MHEKYYLDKLYPLQDSVLQIIESVPCALYLTGGTALSRAYLHHRYSDDLDFFCNAATDFKEQTEAIVTAIKKVFPVTIKVVAPAFLQIFIEQESIELKIDFVNDVPYRVGVPESTPLFSRTDTWMNILSNKLSAVQRQMGKDMADLIFLSKKYEFNWFKAIEHAQGKDMWVNELEVSKLIGTFDYEKFNEVNWIEKPDFKLLDGNLKTIAKDILLGTDNSLFKK